MKSDFKKKSICLLACASLLISCFGCQVAVRPQLISGLDADEDEPAVTTSPDSSETIQGQILSVSDTEITTDEFNYVSDESESASLFSETDTISVEPDITSLEPSATTEESETTTKAPETTTKKPKKTTAKTTKPPETTKNEDPPPATELYAKDYGAVGDGVTDDGPAISRAVRDAVSSQLPLLFEPGKTYRIEKSTNQSCPFKSPFSINGKSNVTIDGRGATFIYNQNVSYFVVANSSNVTIRNCTFDFIDTVYLVGKVIETNGKTVTFSTDVEPYKDFFDYSGYTSFSIKYTTGIQQCSHRFISRMEKTGSKQVMVTYKSNPSYKTGDLVFLPNPGIGHVTSEVIYIGQNRGNLLFENININAAASFVFSVKGNEANITFRNVDFVPSERMRREIDMIAWRDGYHCKDNRCPIIWENCDMDPHGSLFDDIFNVSCTLGTISYVNSDGSFDTLNLEYLKMNRNVGFDCRAGDIIDFYNIETGEFYGTAVVDRTVSTSGGATRIYLKEHTFLSEPPVNSVIGNRATCAPGSVIRNCIFSGSYRFLRDITISDSQLFIRSIWTMVEGSVEGPVPGNVLFRNCELHGGTFEIDALNRNTGMYMPNIAEQISGIRVDNCKYFYFSFTCNTGKCCIEGFNPDEVYNG